MHASISISNNSSIHSNTRSRIGSSKKTAAAAATVSTGVFAVAAVTAAAAWGSFECWWPTVMTIRAPWDSPRWPRYSNFCWQQGSAHKIALSVHTEHCLPQGESGHASVGQTAAALRVATPAGNVWMCDDVAIIHMTGDSEYAFQC